MKLIFTFILKPNKNKNKLFSTIYFIIFDGLCFVLQIAKWTNIKYTVFNTTLSYVHFMTFLEFLQTKIQNYSIAILKILSFLELSRS